MVNGKAKLLRDDYCDGLGDCLPACPVDAIHFVEREAAAYDEAAVLAAKSKKQAEQGKHAGCPGAASRELRPASADSRIGNSIDERPIPPSSDPLPCGCPGSMSRALQPELHDCACDQTNVSRRSQLRQWPVQIKLAPITAPWFQGAKLLIAADCTAYAYASFHEDFIREHVTLVGCPKLDGVDYAEKLAEIIRNNDIESVRVVRMEVPCCGGMEMAVKRALMQSGKYLPWRVTVISTDGRILRD